jgi:hypothetical protein
MKFESVTTYSQHCGKGRYKTYPTPNSNSGLSIWICECKLSSRHVYTCAGMQVKRFHISCHASNKCRHICKDSRHDVPHSPHGGSNPVDPAPPPPPMPMGCDPLVCPPVARWPHHRIRGVKSCNSVHWRLPPPAITLPPLHPQKRANIAYGVAALLEMDKSEEMCQCQPYWGLTYTPCCFSGQICFCAKLTVCIS